MNMYEIIYKKREGMELNADEISYFISGYTNGIIPDYQASALLMAIYFKHLNAKETYHLTDAMRNSGDLIDLTAIEGIKVDKHSTGGVGDKTTLVVGPIAASLGVPVAKMSGRGLGFTGGTVDKLESIPGFETSASMNDFIDRVRKIGISIIGQTEKIAPADKKIYALRDVTATVDNLSLITSSIMSKKLASGSDAIVLDVKCGKGAFAQNLDDAEALARAMVDIGNGDGKKTIAVITDMNQPLGRAVGNSIEVIEAIETLKGKGPADITELSLILAGYMVYCGGMAKTPEQGKLMAQESIKSKIALLKFQEFIVSQGGDKKIVDDYSLFPKPRMFENVRADEDGFVMEIDARTIGMASLIAGAGREKKEDVIDPSAGILLEKKVGEAVLKGEVLAKVHGNDDEKVKSAAFEALKAFTIGKQKPFEAPIIKKIIE